MKYNIDCMRAVLMVLQDLIKVERINKYSFGYSAISLFDILAVLSESDEGNVFGSGEDAPTPPDLHKAETLYSTEDIVYSVDKLEEAGYITTTNLEKFHGVKFVTSITFAGHEFIESIRPPAKWSIVKDLMIKAGSFALSFAAEVARTVGMDFVTEAIDKMK